MGQTRDLEVSIEVGNIRESLCDLVIVSSDNAGRDKLIGLNSSHLTSARTARNEENTYDLPGHDR